MTFFFWSIWCELLPSHDKRLENDLLLWSCSSMGTCGLWCWYNQRWSASIDHESRWWEDCIRIARFGSHLWVAWRHGPHLDSGPRMGLFYCLFGLLSVPRFHKLNSWALHALRVAHLLCKSTPWISSTSLCDFWTVSECFYEGYGYNRNKEQQWIWI